MSEFKLPDSWIQATIPNLISGDGVFIDGDWIESKDQDPNGNIRLIQLADIGDGFFVNKSNRYLTKAKAIELRCTFLVKGDVLIARMPDPLGRACLFPGDKMESVTVVDVCVVRGIEAHFDQRWLMYFINAPEFRERIHSLQSGSTRKRISRGNLSTLMLPIPPRNEQTRIVKKLEEVFSDLDAGVAELKAAQKKLTQYRQSLLKAAVEGTLTAEWRKARTKLGEPLETGAQLLKRILIERRHRWEEKQFAKFAEQDKTPPKDWKDKYPEPVQPDTSELPQLPKGWAWATVDQCTSLITSGSRGWADFYAKEGVLFIRSQDIKTDRLDLSDVAKVLLPTEIEGARTLVERDDILLTITGANVGKCALVANDIDEAYVSQHVALIRPVFKMLGAYLHLFLTCPLGRHNQILEAAYGAGKPGLNLQQIASVFLPLPSMEETVAILRTIVHVLSGIEQQEHSIELSLKQSDVQRKNILQAAFSGQLVAQDPNDEPASVLLESIHAERARRPHQPKPSKIKSPKKEVQYLMTKLLDVLVEANDWITAEEAFRRCGVTDSTSIDRIEQLYAELRELDHANPKRLQVVREGDADKLILIDKAA